MEVSLRRAFIWEASPLRKNLFSALCCIALTALPAAAADPAVVAFGIVDSLVTDLSREKRDFLISDFKSLVKDFTEIESTVLLGGDPLRAAQQLQAGTWHLGVFQGVEFAWAQAKHPQLKPLMVAVYKDPKIQAMLMVKKDSKLTGFADLKGKNVSILAGREHCRLFADKGASGKAKDFFKLTTTNSVEDALDDVVKGKTDAAVVDTANLKIYEEIHPGRFNNLKVLAESETFPMSVIGYYQGVLSEPLLIKLRDGMFKANKSDKGQEIMATFRITRFESVPDNYQESLTKILKAYPPK